jgi:hypothetical protein
MYVSTLITISDRHGTEISIENFWGKIAPNRFSFLRRAMLDIPDDVNLRRGNLASFAAVAGLNPDQIQITPQIRRYTEYADRMEDLEVHFQLLSQHDLYHGAIKDISVITGIPIGTVREWRSKLLKCPNYRPYKDRNRHCRALSDEEEEEIMALYREKFFDKGEICPPKAFHEMALQIYKKRFEVWSEKDDPQTVREFIASRQWREGFFVRHGLSIQMPHYKRRAKVDADYVAKYKNILQKVFRDVHPSNVFNMDETSWSPLSARQKTVAPRGHPDHSSHYTGTDPKDHVTLIATISAAGDTLPLICIASGLSEACEAKFAKALKSECSRGDIFFVHSPNGWVTSDISSQYLTFLRGWCDEHDVKGKVYLLWDVFRAHKTPDVYAHANDLDIDLITVPANGTSLYQPLDIAIFGELKSRARSRLSSQHIQACLDDCDTDFKIPDTLKCTVDAWKKITQDHVLGAWEKLSEALNL